MTNLAAPSYFGADLDVETLEVLTIARIDRKLLQKEAALYASKWFDYRPLHPAAATYLLTHHYNRAYGDFIDKAIDRKKRYRQAIKGKDVMLVRELPSFWRLRQKVDELGMRYDFFLRSAMNWHIEKGWGSNVKHPPRPSHLLCDSQMIIDIANAWVMECRAKIQYAQHPRYTVAAWRGAPDQLAYERFLVEQIRTRPHPRFALQNALYELDALRIEAAIEHLPEQVVHDAIADRLERVSAQ